MSAALNDMRAIWRATTVQRDAGMAAVMRGLVIGALAIAALALVIIGFVASHRGGMTRWPEFALRSGLGIGAVWLGVVGGTLFMPASVQLNSPANARLLPRQRRRLMQMAFGGWLLTTLGIAAAFGSWAGMPAIGLYALGFMLLRGGYPQAVGLLAAGGASPALLHAGLPPALTDAIVSPGGLLVADALLLLAMLWALRLLYPAGGDAHVDRQAARLKVMARFGGNKWAGQADAGAMAGWSLRPLYLTALRRACRTPAPGRLALFALGPPIHWSLWAPFVLLLLAAGAALRLASLRFGGAGLQGILHGFVVTGTGGLVSMILFSTAALSQQMRATRGEQALLRLTPLAGAAAPLNRRLAPQLLRLALINWTMLTAMMLGVTLELGGLDGAALLRQLGLCCLAGQVALMGLLGDYAGGFGWRPALAFEAAVLAIVQAGVAVAIGLLSDTSIWLWLTVIATGTAIVLTRRAWRRMVAAPPAFPAGRFV